MQHMGMIIRQVGIIIQQWGSPFNMWGRTDWNETYGGISGRPMVETDQCQSRSSRKSIQQVKVIPRSHCQRHDMGAQVVSECGVQDVRRADGECALRAG